MLQTMCILIPVEQLGLEGATWGGWEPQGEPVPRPSENYPPKHTQCQGDTPLPCPHAMVHVQCPRPFFSYSGPIV